MGLTARSFKLAGHLKATPINILDELLDNKKKIVLINV